MNRVILFKAKRKDNGEWVEGYYLEQYDTFGKKEYFIFHSNKDGGWRKAEIDHDTLCQYTGLTDKNGRKIWENDILRRDGYWDIRIEFENGAFMVRNADKIQYINRVTYTFISTFDIKEYEVIGNIFDGGFNDGKKTKEN